MESREKEYLVSDQTQAIFQVFIASGANFAGLLALISSAYADGGNYVLDQFNSKIEN